MDINNYTNGFTIEVPSTVQTAFCDKSVTAEIAQDFVLPDYQPEMRKLLRVTPSVRPPSRFLGAGEAEFAGNVSFAVLYIGGDGALYTAELTAPYTFRVPIEGDDRFAGDRPIGADAAISAEPAVTRLTAPRKLNIKCRLNARIVGLCDEETDMRIGGEADGIPMERLEQTRQCARVLFGTGEAMELTDEVTAPAGEGELRLIGTEGAVQITEAVPVEGGIACRGELYWKATVTRDPLTAVFADGGAADGESETATARLEILTRRIPFTQTVELPLTSDPKGWQAMAHGDCGSILARVEDGRILCAATAVLEVQAMGSEKVTFVCDAFSTARVSECAMRKYTYSRPLVCINGNVTESGTVQAAENGIPQGAEPIDLSASASLTDVSLERGHLTLGGECLYRMLYRTANGEFGTAEFRLPLRYEISCEADHAENAPLEMSAHATMLSGRARPDGEGFGFIIDAEWGIAARVTAREEVGAVDEIRVHGPHPEAHGAFILCYPETGESLWKVAKRYHTAIRPLAALNDLPGAADPASPQSLENVHFLMIG